MYILIPTTTRNHAVVKPIKMCSYLLKLLLATLTFIYSVKYASKNVLKNPVILYNMCMILFEFH